MSKPRNSILLNAQERQKRIDNPSSFNVFDVDIMRFNIFVKGFDTLRTVNICI